MFGILENCNWVNTWGEFSNKSLAVDHVQHTSNDAYNKNCGYLVKYTWSGDDDVYFEIQSNGATSMMSTLASYLMVGLFMLIGQ